MADILHGLRAALRNYPALLDPTRVVAYGWSYGAFSALNVLIRAPKLIRGVFCGAGCACHPLRRCLCVPGLRLS